METFLWSDKVLQVFKCLTKDTFSGEKWESIIPSYMKPELELTIKLLYVANRNLKEEMKEFRSVLYEENSHLIHQIILLKHKREFDISSTLSAIELYFESLTDKIDTDLLNGLEDCFSKFFNEIKHETRFVLLQQYYKFILKLSGKAEAIKWLANKSINLFDNILWNMTLNKWNEPQLIVGSLFDYVNIIMHNLMSEEYYLSAILSKAGK